MFMQQQQQRQTIIFIDDPMDVAFFYGPMDIDEEKEFFDAMDIDVEEEEI